MIFHESKGRGLCSCFQILFLALEMIIALHPHHLFGQAELAANNNKSAIETSKLEIRKVNENRNQLTVAR